MKPKSLYIILSLSLLCGIVWSQDKAGNASATPHKWYYPLENQAMTDYLRDFDYNPDDYTYHHLFDYRGAPYPDDRQDWPYGVTLWWPDSLRGASQYVIVSDDSLFTAPMQFDAAPDSTSLTIYNLIPSRRYYYQVVADGRVIMCDWFQTLGQLRMIKTDGLSNVRDLGGWETADGRHVRYGLIYRGSELYTGRITDPVALRYHTPTTADIEMMRNQLHITCDIDYRYSNEILAKWRGVSPLGSDVAYVNDPYQPKFAGQGAAHARIFKKIVQHLQQGEVIYHHCTWGADRTGVMSMLMEAVLGVPEMSINKEFEITSFGTETRLRTHTYLTGCIEGLKACSGSTLQEQCENYLIKYGVKRSEIEAFRQIMLE